MVIKSYAKINLSLTVNKKKLNGLHDIQSVFCLINLFDTITIKKKTYARSDKVYFLGPFSKYVRNSDNSVLKLLSIMRRERLISNYYSIKIHKKIPVFAGLGGGTSNAAAIFKHLIKKKINKSTLDKIVNHIGSDFRLFFYKQGCLKNLKTIVNLKKKYKLNFLLIYPKIKSSTKDVYSRVKNYSKKKFLSQKNFSNKLSFINYLNKTNNDLQFIVEKKYPIIKKLLFKIRKERGCYLSKMTGSGSACYGLFTNENYSKVALKSLRKKYPKFWFSIAKTI